jgi:hypothetical protein
MILFRIEKLIDLIVNFDLSGSFKYAVWLASVEDQAEKEDTASPIGSFYRACCIFLVTLLLLVASLLKKEAVQVLKLHKERLDLSSIVLCRRHIIENIPKDRTAKNVAAERELVV